MKKVFLVSFVASLYIIGCPLQAAWCQTAYKAFTNFWTPPSAPRLSYKTLGAALQEHRAIQKQTNHWFLPTRAGIAGITGSIATLLLGQSLKSHQFEGLIPRHPIIAATTAGLLCTASVWAWLHGNAQTKKRKYNQETLDYGLKIFNTPGVVLERESLLTCYKQTLNRWIDEREQTYYASIADQPDRPSPAEQQKIDRAYQLFKQLFINSAENRIDKCTFGSRDWEEVKDNALGAPQWYIDATQYHPHWAADVAGIKQQCLCEGIEEPIVNQAYSLLQIIIQPIEHGWSPNNIKNCVDLNRLMIRLDYALVPQIG